jgi:hypothetical protein
MSNKECKLDEEFRELLVYLDDEELMNTYNDMFDEIDYEQEVYSNFIELSTSDKKEWIKRIKKRLKK